MLTSATSLLVLVCIVGLNAQDISVDIDISFEDPCAKHQCQNGERCESVVTPQFLGLLPVAHCISVDDNQDSSPCVDGQITAPLLRCKTKKEWEDIGRNQCGLKGAPLLTSTKVRYNCPRPRSRESEYMVFTFTCCSKRQEPSPIPSAKPPQPSDPPRDSNEDTSHDSGLLYGETPDSSSNEQSNLTYLIPIALGVMLLLAFIALVLIVWQRHRSVRHPQKPKMEFATSFVNPSVEHQLTEQDWAVNPLDTTDKSLLIVNEHPRK